MNNLKGLAGMKARPFYLFYGGFGGLHSFMRGFPFCARGTYLYARILPVYARTPSLCVRLLFVRAELLFCVQETFMRGFFWFARAPSLCGRLLFVFTIWFLFYMGSHPLRPPFNSLQAGFTNTTLYHCSPALDYLPIQKQNPPLKEMSHI